MLLQQQYHFTRYSLCIPSLRSVMDLFLAALACKAQECSCVISFLVRCVL